MQDVGGQDDRGGSPPSRIASELGGDLSCHWCGYELRGLSVRDVCPECGTAVKATILALVDPKSHELEPLRRPRVVAGGLVAWSCGAMVAAAAAWWLRAAEASWALAHVRLPTAGVMVVGVVGLVVSGVAACVMVRPLRRLPTGDVARAVVGVASYVPLVALYVALHRDGARSVAYFDGEIDLGRIAVRVVSSACIVGVILGLRPNAVRLAHRSLVVRSGRVDRQSMLALAVTVLVWTVGDGVLLLADRTAGFTMDLALAVGYGLVALGSILFTLGLWGVILDTVRLYPVLSRRARTIADVFEGEGA